MHSACLTKPKVSGQPAETFSHQPPRRRGWWEIGLPCPQPHELIAFAALNCPADIWLDTPETLNRVAEAYIAQCRKRGFWAHMGEELPFHKTGERGYRARLKDYHAILEYWLHNVAPQQNVSGSPLLVAAA